MSIKLDNVDLSSIKGELSLGIRNQTSSVSRIGIIDRRRIIKHNAVSTYGTILSDEGKASARILIEGNISGGDAMNGVSVLRTKYKKGEPISLISDMSLLSNIQKVMIEDLRVQMTSSVQLSYSYQMILREYVETSKKQPTASAPSQKAAALQSVGTEAADTLQEMQQDAATTMQKAQEAGTQAADTLQEMKQDAATAMQKAREIRDAGSQAMTAIENLGNDNISPSQKAQALQEVASKASQVKKEIEEDYF